MPKSLRARKLKGLIGSDDLCLKYEVKQWTNVFVFHEKN